MSEYGHLTRRDFVRDGALGALVLGAGLSARTQQSYAAGAAEGKSTVAVVRDEKVQDESMKVDSAVLKKMLDQAVQAVTGESNAAAGWKKLIKSDDVVGLVPTSANRTHPELVELVRQAILEAGVAADRIQEVQRKKDAVEKCTALVSLPSMKVHTLTGMGTVLKNYITFGPRKASEFHGEKNAEMGSIWLTPTVKGKTRIVIVDALRPLFDKGPQVNPQYQWSYSGLLAGTDPVAVEAIALAILQAKRKAVKGEPWEITPPPLCVAVADKEYKLGTSDLAKIALKVSGWEKDSLISA